MRTRSPLVALLFLLFLTGSLLARVLLCPRCGHEVEPADTVCPHCHKPLPTNEDAAKPAPAPAAETASPHQVPRTVMEAELQRARSELDAKEAGLALLRVRNSAGLLALSPAAPDLVTQLRRLEQESVKVMNEREVVCPACRGEGGMTLLFVTVNGELSQRKAPGTKCPACRGTGRWPARIAARELDDAWAPAQRAFLAAMRGAGWVMSGPVWLPPGFTNLTVREQAAARRAVAAPCETCHGWGVLGCRDCAGSGRTACSESGCVSGHVLCPDCRGTRRMNGEEDGRALTRRCQTCRQTGVADCPTCGGQAYLACETCAGHGDERCATCKGTGEKSLCATCGGEGLRTCTRCKGSGTYRDATCPECGGEGQMLCTNCQGGGRGKR